MLSKRRTTWLVPLGLALITLLPGARPAVGEVPDSVRLVPADASFYSVSLRMREQWQLFQGSRAFASLAQSPNVQLAIGAIRGQWQGGALQPVRMALTQPENQELVKVLREAVSEECFWYGDDGLADWLKLANQLNGAIRTAQLEAQADGVPQEEVLTKRMAELFANAFEELDFPSVVIGFHVQDAEAATRQIARLEQLGLGALQGTPLAGRLSRKQVRGVSTLTLELDGSLLPLDQLPLGDLEGDAKTQMDRLMKQLRQEKLTISLGVDGPHLLLAIGPTQELLAELGSGPGLDTRPELAPLKQFANKPLVDMSYISERFMRKISSPTQQFEDAVAMFRQLSEMAPIPVDLREEIQKDLAKLGEQMRKVGEATEPGAFSAFQFLSPRGYEGYSYAWKGGHLGINRPLAITSFVGGSPILFAVGNAAKADSIAPNAEDIAYWEGRAKYYFEQVLLPQLPPDAQQKAKQLVEQGLPLLQRAGKVLETRIGPGFKDSQGGVVFDAQLRSGQLHRELPRASQPLPVPEFALVTTVADAALLREGYKELYAIGDEVIQLLRKVNPQIPDIKIPRPQIKEVSGGRLYSYSLPEAAGLDSQLAFNVLLTDKVQVVSLAPATSQRLGSATPLKLAGAMAEHNGKPLSSLVRCDTDKLFSVILEWVDYAMEQANPGDPSITILQDEVKRVIDVFRCSKTITAASYVDGEAMVTHHEWHIQDLAP